MHIEKAIRKRTCHECRADLPSGSVCVRIFIQNKHRCFCPDCILKIAFKLGEHIDIQAWKEKYVKQRI